MWPLSMEQSYSLTGVLEKESVVGGIPCKRVLAGREQACCHEDAQHPETC